MDLTVRSDPNMTMGMSASDLMGDTGGGSWTDIFSDPMFYNYLGAAALDLSEKGYFGKNLVNAAMQDTRTKSKLGLMDKYSKNLSTILGGEELPQGSEVKFGDKGMEIKIAPSEMEGAGKIDAGLDPMTMQGTQSQPQQQAPVNPFRSISQDISQKDLVGLTSEDISSALSDVLKLRSSQREDINAMVNRAYQTRLTEESSLRSHKMRKEMQQQIRDDPYNIPNMDFDQWKSLDAKTKAFHAEAFDRKQKGEKELSYSEFAERTPLTTMEKIFKRVEEGPSGEKFRDFYFKSKEAGATKIGDIGPREVERQKVKAFAPGWVGKKLKELSADPERWYKPTGMQKFIDLGIPKAEARQMAQDQMFIDDMKDTIQRLFKDSEVTLGDLGIEVDGELYQRYPSHIMNR